MGQIVSSAVGAFGNVLQGSSEASSAKYNSAVSMINSRMATQNASMIGQAGSAQAATTSMGTRSQVGSLQANQAAGGISVNSGSAVDTRVSAEDLGKLDAMTVRSNATKEAYGQQVQAANFKDQAELDKAEASSDLEAGWIKGAGTLLGGEEDAASNFAKFAMAGGMG